MCLTHMSDTVQMLLESEWLRVFTQGAHCVMPTSDNTGLLSVQMSLKLGVSFVFQMHYKGWLLRQNYITFIVCRRCENL